MAGNWETKTRRLLRQQLCTVSR